MIEILIFIRNYCICFFNYLFSKRMVGCNTKEVYLFPRYMPKDWIITDDILVAAIDVLKLNCWEMTSTNLGFKPVPLDPGTDLSKYFPDGAISSLLLFYKIKGRLKMMINEQKQNIIKVSIRRTLCELNVKFPDKNRIELSVTKSHKHISLDEGNSTGLAQTTGT